MTNIAKLLKDVPGCITLWSSVYGKVWLLKVEDNIIYVSSIDGSERKFDEYGRISVDGILSQECLLFPSKEVRNWERWEMPYKPNFKVNDWIIFDRTFTIPIQIVEVNQEDDVYVCRSIEGLYGNYDITHTDKNYHLWTIKDAKDGDVLVTDFFIFLFKKVDSGNGIHYYCHCGVHGEEFDIALPDSLMGRAGNTLVNYHPATKEQHNLLFQKMQEAGYDWDEKKKELKKIKKHYDISSFHAGMPVLVRDDKQKKWCYALYSHYDNEDSYQFVTAGDNPFIQCIPFDGNEHLLGTTDMPSDEFINW